MIDPSSFIQLLNTMPTSWVLVLMTFFCLFSLAILGRFFGASGLLSYYVIGTLIGNIQVLKGAQFSFYPEPVALGTTLYSSLFLCNNLLTHLYSKNLTLEGIRLSSVTFALFAGFMIITLGYHPIPTSYGLLHNAHEAMITLFVPMPSLIVASIIAFIVSERSTTFFFIFLKTFFKAIPLRIASFSSMVVGQVLDTCLFSILAWKVLSPTGYSWHTILHTYILGTLIFRCCLSAIFSLCFPLLLTLLKKRKKDP